MAKFTLTILTPNKKYPPKNVDEINVFSDTGQISILANHSEYLGNVDISLLSIKIDNEVKNYAVGGGCIHFINEDNCCRLILNSIIEAKDIDVSKALLDESEARKMLDQSRSLLEHLDAERKLKKAINNLEISRNFK